MIDSIKIRGETLLMKMKDLFNLHLQENSISKWKEVIILLNKKDTEQA